MNHFPVQVHARRDPHLSWRLWLVKRLLLVPHYVILAGLWIAFVVMTVVAYVAVLFTGGYPPAIFAFNVGVPGRSWRVCYQRPAPPAGPHTPAPELVRAV